MKCDAWVGLEIPMSASCDLELGHDGPHMSKFDGARRLNVGEYSNDVDVTITWSEPDARE